MPRIEAGDPTVHRQQHLLTDVGPSDFGNAGLPAPALDQRTIKVDQLTPRLGRALARNVAAKLNPLELSGLATAGGMPTDSTGTKGDD